MLLRVRSQIAEQLLHHERARLGVEGRERLVHQEHRRVHRERARDADPLAHAARELVRDTCPRSPSSPVMLEVTRAPLGCVPPGAGPAPRGRTRRWPATVRHGKSANSWKTVAVSGAPGRPSPSKYTVPRGGGQEPRDDVEQRRLAAARGPEDGHELLGLDGEARPPRARHLLARPVAVGLGQPVDDDPHAGHSRRRKHSGRSGRARSTRCSMWTPRALSALPSRLARRPISSYVTARPSNRKAVRPPRPGPDAGPGTMRRH